MPADILKPLPHPVESEADELGIRRVRDFLLEAYDPDPVRMAQRLGYAPTRNLLSGIQNRRAQVLAYSVQPQTGWMALNAMLQPFLLGREELPPGYAAPERRSRPHRESSRPLGAEDEVLYRRGKEEAAKAARSVFGPTFTRAARSAQEELINDTLYRALATVGNRWSLLSPTLLRTAAAQSRATYRKGLEQRSREIAGQAGEIYVGGVQREFASEAFEPERAPSDLMSEKVSSEEGRLPKKPQSVGYPTPPMAGRDIPAEPLLSLMAARGEVDLSEAMGSRSFTLADADSILSDMARKGGNQKVLSELVSLHIGRPVLKGQPEKFLSPDLLRKTLRAHGKLRKSGDKASPCPICNSILAAVRVRGLTPQIVRSSVDLFMEELYALS